MILETVFIVLAVVGGLIFIISKVDGNQ